jgi:hypothetical protein
MSMRNQGRPTRFPIIENIIIAIWFWEIGKRDVPDF